MKAINIILIYFIFLIILIVYGGIIGLVYLIIGISAGRNSKKLFDPLLESLNMKLRRLEIEE